MVFLCFRSKKATKDETLIVESKSKVIIEEKKSNIKNAGKSSKETHERKVVPVKLAPRTTLLKTPKQVVGARIARALHDKQNPDLETMHTEIKRQSRSPSPTRTSAASPKSNIHEDHTGKENEAYDAEKPSSKPTSPKLRVSTNVLASNGIPTNELMEALARRAARQADRRE